MCDGRRYIGIWVLTVLFVLSQPAVSQGQPVAPTSPTVPIRPVPTDRVVLQIYESTLDKLATAVLPVSFSGHYTYSVSACIPGTNDCVSTDICSSDWQVAVTQIKFAIAPSGIRLSGTGSGTWCHVSVEIELDTTVNVALQMNISLSTIGAAPSFQSATPVNPASSITGAPRSRLVLLPNETSIQVTVSPTNVQPVFNIPGYTVKLPFHIDIAPVLDLPPIPLTPAPITLGADADTTQLHLVPSEFVLFLRDHYIELQSTMQLH